MVFELLVDSVTGRNGLLMDEMPEELQVFFSRRFGPAD